MSSSVFAIYCGSNPNIFNPQIAPGNAILNRECGILLEDLRQQEAVAVVGGLGRPGSPMHLVNEIMAPAGLLSTVTVPTEQTNTSHPSDQSQTTLTLRHSLLRNAAFMALTDHAIVLPGGFGVLHEIMDEIYAMEQGQVPLQRRLLFLNADGYFDCFRNFITGSSEHSSFIARNVARRCLFFDSAESLAKASRTLLAPAGDFRFIDHTTVPQLGNKTESYYFLGNPSLYPENARCLGIPVSRTELRDPFQTILKQVLRAIAKEGCVERVGVYNRNTAASQTLRQELESSLIRYHGLATEEDRAQGISMSGVTHIAPSEAALTELWLMLHDALLFHPNSLHDCRLLATVLNLKAIDDPLCRHLMVVYSGAIKSDLFSQIRIMVNRGAANMQHVGNLKQVHCPDEVIAHLKQHFRQRRSASAQSLALQPYRPPVLPEQVHTIRRLLHGRLRQPMAVR
ncbi:MAG: LOG family protein [Dongiaceae bacterium]